MWRPEAPSPKREQVDFVGMLDVPVREPELVDAIALPSASSLKTNGCPLPAGRGTIQPMRRVEKQTNARAKARAAARRVPIQRGMAKAQAAKVAKTPQPKRKARAITSPLEAKAKEKGQRMEVLTKKAAARTRTAGS